MKKYLWPNLMMMGIVNDLLILFFFLLKGHRNALKKVVGLVSPTISNLTYWNQICKKKNNVNVFSCSAFF